MTDRQTIVLGAPIKWIQTPFFIDIEPLTNTKPLNLGFQIIWTQFVPVKLINDETNMSMDLAIYFSYIKYENKSHLNRRIW